MDTTITFISELYQGQLSPLRDQVEYEHILGDIKCFGAEAQIYHMLREQELMNAVPDFFTKELKRRVDPVLFQNLFIKSEQKKILTAFEQQGIPVIQLKGVWFTERYFKHISARATSDIDLLVHPEDVQKSEDILSELGFHFEEGDPAHFHILLAKSYDNPLYSRLETEIHWNISRQNNSNTEIDYFWSESSLISNYTYVRELSLQQTFYHICLHGISHHMSSLKYILDILQLIHYYGDDMDYERLLHQASSDHNYSKVVLALSLVYKLFPYLQERKPLSVHKKYPLWSMDLARRVMQEQKDIRYFFFRVSSAFATYDTWKHKLSSLRYILFPPQVYFKHEIGEEKSVIKSYFKLYLSVVRTWLNAKSKTL
ncbi:nucleotidyltransferase family protein [Paenibacillus sediminis]|uniref:Nucleotidyltransferase family protein n=1 Tax=Paenibacillus sediminis TaxID=664909 RepID=A0ABS4H4B6_9BACL|nr:nucleotidyltransferase family protein [Paenibacillus sediminis]MBP1937374.1 hypothetical protein [Paenibacillus sediminis]